MNPHALYRAFREVFANATPKECAAVGRAMELYERANPTDRDAQALSTKLEALSRKYDAEHKRSMS